MKQSIIWGMGFISITVSLQAKEMNLFEKWRYNHDRKEAFREIQEITQSRDANYQQALMTFEAFDKKFNATSAEKEKFRHWKKSVRGTTTPDGIIYDPQTYIDELESFRLKPAIPNPDEEPVFYPAPPSVGQKLSWQIPNQYSAGNWFSMGYRGDPKASGQGATGNGAAEGVTIDPNNPAIVYACIRNGGLWKSTNYGVTYTPMTDYFESPHTHSIGIGKTNSNVLYLSTDSKIWYSTDAGLSWEDRSNGLSGTAEEIHVDPTDANRALAATEKGLYATSDGGLNWRLVLSGIFREIETTSNWHTLGVTKDAGSSSALQAPVFYLSTDHGETWVEKQIPSTQGDLTRMYLAFSERSVPDSLVIYTYLIKVNSTNLTNFAGLWRSNNRGVAFSEVTNPNYTYTSGPVQLTSDGAGGFKTLDDSYGGVNPYWTSSWVGEFFVDPKNPNNLLTMREKCWVSNNGGQSWVYGPSYGEVGWADRRFCTANPQQDSLYLCDDGGVWAVPFSTLFNWTGSAADKLSFRGKNGNIAAPEGTNCAISEYNKDVFMTGGQDVGQVFQRNGRSFHTAFADIYRGNICPTNDSLYWTGGFRVKVENDTNAVELSNEVEPDHFNPKRIYGFTKTGVLMRTRDTSNAWTAPIGRAAVYGDTVNLTTTGVTAWNGWTFEQSRATPELAFIGDEKGKQLFMTENLSAAVPTWTKVASAPALGRYRIATHQYNDKMIAIASDKAVWISRDKGTTWEVLSGFPATGVLNIYFDRNTQEGLYVCNSMTVWYRDETLSNWIEFNKGLPLQNIEEMKIAYYADGDARLLVAKYGRGVWASPLYATMKTKPVRADFGFQDKTAQKSAFYVGDTARLYDLSTGMISSRSWRLTGPETKTAVSDSAPLFTFTKAGTYSVSLAVKGDAGSDSIMKVGYIRISDRIKTVDSVPATDTTGGAWYLGIKTVSVNGTAHNSNGNTKLFYEDLTGLSAFSVSGTDSVTVQIVPTQNDATWGVSYAKVWLDMDNSGSFSANELIYDSVTKKQGHTFTFLPSASAPRGTPIRMRVSVNRTTPVTDAYQSQISQGQVEDHAVIIAPPTPTVTVAGTAAADDSLSLSATYANTGTVVDAGFIVTAFKPGTSINDVGRFSTGVPSKGTFTAGKGSLVSNRTYYVRSYVIDQYGTYLSEVDTIVPPTRRNPILESLIPTFDFTAKKWTLNGRIHGESNSIDSVWYELTVDSAKSIVPITSVKGVRNQWDTIPTVLSSMKRYSTGAYRIHAIVGGTELVSTERTFSSEPGLYAYWNFDETGSTIYDRSGNNRHAVLGATMTRVSDSLGGSALLFDTTTDVSTIGLSNLQPPFTLQFRVNRAKNSTVNYAVLLNGSSRRLDLEVWNNTHQLGVAYPGTYDRASGIVTPIGQWHTYTMVGVTDSVRIYADGAYVKTIAAAGYTLPLTSFGLNAASMLGSLDEVKVWNRNLDSAEIVDGLKRPQVVSFDPIANRRVGSGSFNLHAVSSLGKSIHFAVVKGNSKVTITDSVVTALLDSGTVTIRAYAGGDSIALADSADQTFTVIQKNGQVVTFDPIADCQVGDPEFTLHAVSSAGKPIRFAAVDGDWKIVLSDSTVTELLDSGTVTIRAHADGDTATLANSADQTFTIARQSVALLKKQQTGSGISVEITPNPAAVSDGQMAFRVQGKALVRGTVTIYDPVGNIVASLELQAEHDALQTTWNLHNSSGAAVGNGAYAVVISCTHADGWVSRFLQMVGIQN